MNPAYMSRFVGSGLIPVRFMGCTINKPEILRRSFITVTGGRQSVQTARIISSKSQYAIAPIMRRSFSSSGSSFNLPTRTFAFFTLSSLGIVGGFYVISYSLRV